MKGQHIFAGNNTSNGFVNYFHSIFNPYEADKMYILKGGSGVGKSSFIKKFAKIMESKNHEVEYIHCSSDEESLDGIWVPDYRVAILDGTAPHMIDPVIPGAVDSIINLGNYLDQAKLKSKKREIVQIAKAKSRCYKSAYRYLQAAGMIQLENNELIKNCINYADFYSFKEHFIENVFSQKEIESSSFSRKFFSEAYTASGYVDYTSTLYQSKRIWALIGNRGNLSSELLASIVAKSEEKGYHVDQIFNPLVPDMRNHIYIYNLNLLITTATTKDSSLFEEEYDIDQYIKQSPKGDYQLQYDENQLMQNQLLDYGIKYLAKAKEYHGQLEAIYVNAMNFSGSDQCFELFLSEWNQ